MRASPADSWFNSFLHIWRTKPWNPYSNSLFTTSRQTLNVTIVLHKGRTIVTFHMNKQLIFNIKNDKEWIKNIIFKWNKRVEKE